MEMGKTQLIPISQISTREAARLRPANPERVLMIAASIRKRGQLQPIGVYSAPNEQNGARPWVLVFGLHRLLACQHLGFEEVEIKEVGSADARHAEIEENLFRADLTALDRAIAVRELRQLHEAEHGEVKRGGHQSAKSALWSDEIVEIAEKVGLSKRSLKYADKIGRKICATLQEALRGNSAADNQSVLLKLSNLTPDRQQAVAQAIALGADVKEAITASDPDPAPKPTKQVALLSRLIGAWSEASADTRAQFLQHIEKANADEA